MSDELDRKLDASETAILESAYAIDRLSEPIPDDPTDVRLGPTCPRCGRALIVDVSRHADALLGVVRGFEPCECAAG